MKIVFIEPAGAGGISHCTYALARALGEQGTHCTVLTGEKWEDRPLPVTVKVHRLFRGKKTNPFRLWLQCYHWRTWAEVVHWQTATYPRLMLWFMRLNPLRRIPWVYTVHNVLPHETQESSQRLYANIYSRMQGLIFHTRHSQTTFQNYFPEIAPPSAIIPLGEYGFLIPGRIRQISVHTPPVVLFFGNIRPYKGLDVLLRALPLIRQQIPEAKLLIAGQPMSSFVPYQQLIREHNLVDCVETRFGYIPDSEIPQLLNSVAVAALPYREIDQSAVLMLMMAYGMPMVASRVGGLEEIIRDKQTGSLVPANHVQALANSLIHLLRNPQDAHRLGENARHDAGTHFSWNSIAKQTLKFYQSIIQKISNFSPE